VSKINEFISNSNLCTFQIWASKGGGQHKPPTDLVFKQKESWGVGKETKTVLRDSNGQVRVIVWQFAVEDVKEPTFCNSFIV